MDYIKFELRNRKLLKKSNQLEEELEQIVDELKQMEQQCAHSIIVHCMFESELTGEYDRGICLFCRTTEPFHRRNYTEELQEKQKKAVNIEVEYSNFFEEKGKSIFNVLLEIYKEIRKKFPDDTEEEIAKKVKEELKYLKLKIE